MPRSPLPIRFGHAHRRALYGVLLGLWLSGALWLLFHCFFFAPGEFGPTPHPLEKWWLRLHGLFAFATLVALGSVLPVHVRGAWQKRKNRATGVTLTAWVLWLAATGYALYYFATEANEAWLPVLHWAPALALPLALQYHVRRRRARPARRIPPMPASAGMHSHQPASSAPTGIASQPPSKRPTERRNWPEMEASKQQRAAERSAVPRAPIPS